VLRVTVPYGRHAIDDADLAAVAAALQSDRITQGPRVEEFEEALAAAVGAKYAVAVSSGTAALHLAALAAGIGPGDILLTSPITFVASANCAVYCGARPDFVDVDPPRVALDPEALEAYLQKPPRAGRPRAVVPVDFGGHPADLERIGAIAEAHGLIVIEDACHALGATWTDRAGKTHRIGDGSHAQLTVFSFHPVKHVTTGEGGAITTNDGALRDRVRALRSHGIHRDPRILKHQEGPWYYEMQSLGYNYRITDFQCALGRSQLRKLDRVLARRREIAARYDAAFRDHPLLEPLAQPAGTRSAYHLYVVQVRGACASRRREVFEALVEAGMGVNVHYIPVTWQPYYQERFGFTRGEFPHAEDYYRRAITIPLFPTLSDAQVTWVIDAVCSAVERVAAVASSV
jgi:perosamine synthetase